ncbi:MAG: hypothetical protein K2J58_00165 [Muribaculaceae bacterium]|nr:hypothetical protein [Muribaculaceae bacterium]
MADRLMESHSDSALAILESMEILDIKEKREKARYALLKSMALDKNYVDTTTFDILKPAIDYYLDNGTPDEKLRTYYYQGRIYQNRNERDSALHSFMRALDIAGDCEDSLTIARTFVMQGILFQSFYDYEGYTNSYLKAANIYQSKFYKAYEFDCLMNALNGSNILGKKEQADSIINILDMFRFLDDAQLQRLLGHRITYALQFGSEQDLKELIETNKVSLRYTGILNLARAYYRLGDNDRAIQQLEYLDKATTTYDTLKYLSIKYPILEKLKKYEEALSVYKDLVVRMDSINVTKFEQKSQSMEEKHQMELQAEREAMEHTRIIWRLVTGVGTLILVILIMLLMLRGVRIRKNLALEQVRVKELENGKLKAEKEKLALANENLKLERDNKALEAENLANRVAELEGESENLRELLDSQKEMPEEVRKAIQTRIEMLNAYLASQISDHKEFEKAYDDWVAELTADKERFMDSNRLALQASHPAFIKYFEDHGLTTAEINYVCLYAIGLRGKDVGTYMKMRSHVNISSAIRRKLGIDRHETNIGIYVRKLLKEL